MRRKEKKRVDRRRKQRVAMKFYILATKHTPDEE